MKTCTKCGEIKSLGEFSDRENSKDGKRAQCKPCLSSIRRKWRENNREKENTAKRKRYKKNWEQAREYSRKWHESRREQEVARKRRWYRENADRAKEYSQKWRENNPESVKASYRQWYAASREQAIASSTRWRDENVERARATQKAWAEGNRDRVREKNRQWYHANKHDPEFRSARAARGMLGKFLFRTRQEKSGRTHEVLGYSAEQLREHLERQFTKGMTWDNYGEWHIDHIVPVAEHIRNGEADPAVVNCLTNLRPMWAEENMRKSDKRTHLL